MPVLYIKLSSCQTHCLQSTSVLTIQDCFSTVAEFWSPLLLTSTLVIAVFAFKPFDLVSTLWSYAAVWALTYGIFKDSFLSDSFMIASRLSKNKRWLTTKSWQKSLYTKYFTSSLLTLSLLYHSFARLYSLFRQWTLKGLY